MPSPDPNLDAEIPILSSRLLASARRSAWVTTSAGPDGVDIDVHQGELPNDATLQEGFESAGSVTCPITGITAPSETLNSTAATTVSATGSTRCATLTAAAEPIATRPPSS